MLKIGRKYNIGYDTIVAGKDQRRKMPLWHHVGVLDNHLWNKKLAVRATRAEYSRRFLSLNYTIEWVTTHLQEIPQRIR